jgi:hypothetical protein
MDDRRFDRKLNGMTFSIKARMAINWLAYTQPKTPNDSLARQMMVVGNASDQRTKDQSSRIAWVDYSLEGAPS